MNPIMYHDSVTKKWGSIDLSSIMIALPETIAQKIRILQYPPHHHPKTQFIHMLNFIHRSWKHDPSDQQQIRYTNTKL